MDMRIVYTPRAEFIDESRRPPPTSDESSRVSVNFSTQHHQHIHTPSLSLYGLICVRSYRFRRRRLVRVSATKCPPWLKPKADEASSKAPTTRIEKAKVSKEKRIECRNGGKQGLLWVLCLYWLVLSYMAMISQQ